MKIGIIGGGAAGFMAAVAAKEVHPASEVTILEKSHKLLAKVKVSGGGRCNVTNATESPSLFAKQYPRGEKQLKKAFAQFFQKDIIEWFRIRGVKLKTEPDGRMFPISNTSQTIIDCFLREAHKRDITLKTGYPVEKILVVPNGFEVHNKSEKFFLDKLLVATGGSPKLSGFDWLAELGHKIVPPVPSLFTFNMPDESIKSLQGLAAPDVKVRIMNSKLSSKGPLLVTHWGMSGPAILKLSAWGARVLSDMGYQFNLAVSWVDRTDENVRFSLNETAAVHKKKRVANANPFDFPQRLWDFLLQRAGIGEDRIWGECGKKDFNRITEILINDIYKVRGKTTFKEEFVTCGGVDLSEVDFQTMESRVCPGLFFAGEVLDIDGITGGFNFQAAWTTGYIAGRSMASLQEHKAGI